MYTKKQENYITHLRALNRRLSEKEYQVLYRLSYNLNSTLRSEVAELLCDHYTLTAEKILLRMTYDINSIVRLQAVDSLCIGRTTKSLIRLKKLLYSRDALIRAYSAMSLINVVQNRGEKKEKKYYDNVLKKFLSYEKDHMVKIMVEAELYDMGYKKFFYTLIQTIHKDIMVNKEKNFWLIMNVFDNIIDEFNKEIIIKEVENIKEGLKDSTYFNIFEKRICESQRDYLYI